MRNARAPQRAGLILIEVMGLLILLAAFSLVSAQLFHAILSTTRHAQDVPRTEPRREELLARMRADVWTAMEVHIANERELILRLAGERSIFWRIVPESEEEPGALRRTELLGTRQVSRELWSAADGSVPGRFERFGPAVRVNWPQSGTHRGALVDFYSQLNLMAGGGR